MSQNSNQVVLQTRARAGENPSLDCANWVNNFSAALASGFSSELNRRGAQSCQLLHFDEELMRLCSHRFLSPERGGENIREKGALVPFSFDMQMTDTATICFPSPERETAPMIDIRSKISLPSNVRFALFISCFFFIYCRAESSTCN